MSEDRRLPANHPAVELTFELRLTADKNGYRADVLNSPGGQGTVTFTPPPAVADLDRLAWLPGRARRQLRLAEPNSAAPPLSPQQVGEQLYAAVFAGEVGACFLLSLDRAQQAGGVLRVQLRIDRTTPELADLPWEYLYDTQRGRFLALWELTPLVRYAELPLAAPALQVTPPLQILGVVANPAGVPALAVEQEWARLVEALQPLAARRLIHLHRLEKASGEALQSYLRQATVHVLHFIGHGRFDPQQAQGSLVFEDEQGRAALLPAPRVSTLLADHAALRLVFLNACEGARSGRDDFFTGTAQVLIQQGIPAVIAMQNEVSDRGAVALSREFYRALADGYAVDRALTEARKALYVAGEEAEWGTPVLFSRSAENRLFIMPRRPPRRSFERKAFEPETVLVEGGPFLMGSDSAAEEQPAHVVELPDYWIGKYPVTNREYAEFLQRNKLQEEPKKLGWFLRRSPAEKLNHPVVGVSWHDARAYCVWLSQATGRTYRLPSEAEWEKAARGADGRRFPWGDQWLDGRANLSSTETTPVDQYPDGASPYGCLDLLGNAQEWTQTIWGSRERECDYPYPYRADDGREQLPVDDAQPARALRIYRSGSLRSTAAAVRCSARAGADPLSKVTWRGFRVVLPPPDTVEPSGS